MTMGCWGVQGGASSTLVEAPQAPDRRAPPRRQSGRLKRVVGLVVVVGLGGTPRRQQFRLLPVDGGAAGVDHGEHLQYLGREVERGRGQLLERGRLLGAEPDVERLE